MLCICFRGGHLINSDNDYNDDSEFGVWRHSLGTYEKSLFLDPSPPHMRLHPFTKQWIVTLMYS